MLVRKYETRNGLQENRSGSIGKLMMEATTVSEAYAMNKTTLLGFTIDQTITWTGHLVKTKRKWELKALKQKHILPDPLNSFLKTNPQNENL